MKLTRDNVHVWGYQPTKEDCPEKGEFHGWCERKSAFKHYRCDQYFTDMNEPHDCRHWSENFLNKLEKYTTESQSYHRKSI